MEKATLAVSLITAIIELIVALLKLKR